jgi:hypothetical protein
MAYVVQDFNLFWHIRLNWKVSFALSNLPYESALPETLAPPDFQSYSVTLDTSSILHMLNRGAVIALLLPHLTSATIDLRHCTDTC